MSEKFKPKESIVGCLMGTAVGDSLGLPMEGLSKRRQRKIFPEIKGHHLFFGKGMISDDTEHTCIVAQALTISAGSEAIFSERLARFLRLWLLALPAGVGFATLKALSKLCLGFSPEKSGVFSAGNGPAMRSAIIGVCYGDNPQKLKNLVKISTRISHTDPKAEYGALAVALAAYCSSREILEPNLYFESLTDLIGEEGGEFLELVQKAVKSASTGETTENFAADLGLKDGVSGYMYHTVPVVLHAWFCYPKDYRTAVLEIIRTGGDTDTTAAILGGIVGAGVGKKGVPEDWIANLTDWPRSTEWIEKLGEALAATLDQSAPSSTPTVSYFATLIRNIAFAAIVLSHGFRRLAPPYG